MDGWAIDRIALVEVGGWVVEKAALVAEGGWVVERTAALVIVCAGDLHFVVQAHGSLSSSEW